MGELTPWEEINPTTALAPRPEPLSLSSARRRLLPADTDTFRRELTACLALVVPVGMTEEARREWLTVAWGTLQHLPADLLEAGCRKAREIADHPCKIVPAIIAETATEMDRRRETVRSERQFEWPQIGPPPEDICTPEQAAAIMAEFGLRRNPLDTTSETPQ